MSMPMRKRLLAELIASLEDQVVDDMIAVQRRQGNQVKHSQIQVDQRRIGRQADKRNQPCFGRSPRQNPAWAVPAITDHTALYS